MNNPISETLIKILDEFGIPYSIKNNKLYIKVELDNESITENSVYYSLIYHSKNGTEIQFYYNFFGGTVSFEFRSKDGKKKSVHLGVNIYYNLQDDQIIIKPLT